MNEKLQISVNATFRQKAQVDLADAVTAIKQTLGFECVCGEFLTVKDGVLMRGKDVSYHGSPNYKYTEVSNNPNIAALYNSVKLLEEYANNTQADKWAKHIKK